MNHRSGKIRVLTKEAADRQALRVVKAAKTGKISPRRREDGFHDFIVSGLACSVCGGAIYADGIMEEYEENGVKFGCVDGVIWYCKKCGEVGLEGRPVAPVEQG